MNARPRLLIISAVYPFPRNAGQQQRVYYTLRALRADFHLTFLTTADQREMVAVREKLLRLCDDAIVLPSVYTRNFLGRLIHKVIGTGYALFTGLKFSNYLTGEVEFSPHRITPILDSFSFDGVLYEYWHAHKTTLLFRQHGIPSILDMHDVLWRSYTRQLDAKRWLPGLLGQMRIKQYRSHEESAWRAFDMLIAINQAEHDYACRVVGDGRKVFYTPMGTDISEWQYSWQPALPPRIAYYGSLGSSHNQQDALTCYREIMPLIWQKYPAAELWIVGSNPPDFIRDLSRDSRVQVTGFVEHPQDMLKTMSFILCPWSGTYGFRSRIVEVMALGIPVIASPDAIHGMGFDIGFGIVLGGNPLEMADLGLKLLDDQEEAVRQSRFARRQVEDKFSYEATYVNFSTGLADFFKNRLG